VGRQVSEPHRFIPLDVGVSPGQNFLRNILQRLAESNEIALNRVLPFLIGETGLQIVILHAVDGPVACAQDFVDARETVADLPRRRSEDIDEIGLHASPHRLCALQTPVIVQFGVSPRDVGACILHLHQVEKRKSARNGIEQQVVVTSWSCCVPRH
jgi:hypothetical protein